MATETIREFLVKLGFKADEGSLRKFTGSIGTVTKGIALFAGAIEGAAVAVAAFAEKTATDLEKLYFNAQKAGTSARALRALETAAQNLGASGGEATSAVEHLATAFRENIGNIGVVEALIGKMGLQLKRNADGSIDAQDAFLKLIETFKHGDLPYMVIKQFSDELTGLSEGTLNQLVHGALMDEFVKELNKLGAGFDEATKRAHEFQNEFREFIQRWDDARARIEMGLFKPLLPDLEAFSRWIDQHSGDIAKVAVAFEDAAGIILQLAKDVYIGWKLIFDEMKEGHSWMQQHFPRLTKWAGEGASAGAQFILGGGPAGLLLRKLAPGALQDIGERLGIRSQVGELWDSLGGLGETDSPTHPPPSATVQSVRAQEIAQALSQSLHLGQQQIAGLLSRVSWESAGFDPDAENPTTHAYGLGQWLDPSRIADFQRFIGRSLRGSTFEEQLRFMVHELSTHSEFGLAQLARAQSPEEAYDIFTHAYEAPGRADEARTAVAGHERAERIYMTLHINGANDPQMVARQVVDELQRQIGPVTRDVSPGVAQ